MSKPSLRRRDLIKSFFGFPRNPDFDSDHMTLPADVVSISEEPLQTSGIHGAEVDLEPNSSDSDSQKSTALALTDEGCEGTKCDSEAEYSSPESLPDKPKSTDQEKLPDCCGHDSLGNASGNFAEEEDEDDFIPQEKVPKECLESRCRGVQDPNTFWCNLCRITVCSECWGLQTAHKTKDAKRHKQIKPQDQDMLHQILRNEKKGEYDMLDYSSKWFGVKVRGKSVSLTTTSRYRELSMDTEFGSEQYPALISFVGETGAGKSTLISALSKVVSDSSTECCL